MLSFSQLTLQDRFLTVTELSLQQLFTHWKLKVKFVLVLCHKLLDQVTGPSIIMVTRRCQVVKVTQRIF